MTTVIHIRESRKSEDEIYIGRPSKWGNPFTHKQGTRASIVVSSRKAAIKAFKLWFHEQPQTQLRADAIKELKNKKLVCFCKPHTCHGDILAEYVNAMNESIPF